MIKNFCLAAVVAVAGGLMSAPAEAEAGDCYGGRGRSFYGSPYRSAYRGPVHYRSVPRYSVGYRGFAPVGVGFGSPAFGPRVGGFGHPGFGYPGFGHPGFGNRGFSRGGISIGFGF